MTPKKNPGKKRGPKPERLKLSGSWEDNVRKGLAVKRPAEGWPKPAKVREEE